MKPMIILPPDTMSPEDIKLLRENDICVVVAANPASVKFVDPIPVQSSRTQIETAAIGLSRRLLQGDLFPNNRGDFARLYIDCLIKGTPLDPNPEPTKEQRGQAIFDSAKAEELTRLAKEEARQERAAAKVIKANPKPAA